MIKHRLFFTVATLASIVCWPALAEQADRTKPTNIEADALSYDDVKQFSVFTGNVVLVRGSVVIRGDRLEVRKDPEGFQYGTAIGSAKRPASFRQKRDAVDEYIEGTADRIEYDDRNDRVVLTGQAFVQRLSGASPIDEASGHQIIYENRSDEYHVVGGKQAATPNNPQGRVRATIAAPATPPKTPGTPNVTPLQPADSVANPRPARRTDGKQP